MAEAHEQMEQAEHVEHAAGYNKRIALLIAVIALFLAFSETLGKSAQTEAIRLNIKASDTWSFFQAKTIRQTSLRIAADAMALQAASAPNDEAKAALTKQIEDWRATATRYESDSMQKDGRKELQEQAEHYEQEHDMALARYHQYELASAAFQIGIVLCSAAIITSMIALAYVAGGAWIIGIAFMALGLFAPHAIHFG